MLSKKLEDKVQKPKPNKMKKTKIAKLLVKSLVNRM